MFCLSRASKAPLAAGLITSMVSLNAWGADGVALKFDWPDNLLAKVSVEASRQRTVGKKTRHVDTSLSYHLSARAMDQGFIVKFSEFRVGDVLGSAGKRSKLQGFLSRTVATLPDVVVNRRGEFVRLDRVDELVAAMNSEMENVIRDLPSDSRKRMRMVLPKIMNRAVFESKMADHWNQMVGAWIGGEFEQGAVYETSHKTEAAVLGNAQLQMNSRFRMLGRDRCTRGEVVRRCVELEMVTRSKDQAIAKAMEGLVRGLARQSTEEIKFDRMQLENTVRLLTEPDTLVPHRVYQKKTIRVRASASGGKRTVAERIDISNTAYKY